jgi:two-component system cell cycle sensor histidine kinase/response regulator CckA
VSRPQPLKVILVEDSETDAELLVRELTRRGFTPQATRVETGDGLREALAAGDCHVVISDNRMPAFNAREALAITRELAPNVPFIVVSGTLTEEHAVDAMRAGAHDFVTKDNLHRLVPAIERELVEAERRAEQQRMAAALAESQQRLRQAQKLEAVGRLAAGVAHDFNNLLAAILSYAELVLRGLPPDSAQRADVEEIKRVADRAAGIVRQLLAFSRRQVSGRDALNLNQVVHEGMSVLRHLVGRSITIHPKYHPTLWSIAGDQNQLEQVLINLTLNARDAMAGGGTLTIATSNVIISEPGLQMPKAPGQYVRLDVIDTGEGIPPDVLPQIFEPFFTTKDVDKGTGLGLASVYGIVDDTGGEIFVDSQPGRGARFTMYFPRLQSASSDAPARG